MKERQIEHYIIVSIRQCYQKDFKILFHSNSRIELELPNYYKVIADVDLTTDNVNMVTIHPNTNLQVLYENSTLSESHIIIKRVMNEYFPSPVLSWLEE